MFIVLIVIGIVGAAPKGLATTSLTLSAAESFLRDALLNKQLRIEIWAPKKGTGQWSAIRKVCNIAFFLLLFSFLLSCTNDFFK